MKNHIKKILAILIAVCVAVIPSFAFADNAYTEPTTDIPEHCYDDDSHSMPLGGVGQWFDDKEDFISYYNSVAEEWNDKWLSGEISNEEYYANCPSGYECWSCSYCSKWTGNFKYSEVTEPSTDDPSECQHEWAYHQYGSSHYKYCVKCGKGSYEPCTYSSEITAPTCTKQGYTTYICIYCGATMTGDFTPATGHNFKYVSNGDGTHHQVCSNCGTVTANENCVRTVVEDKVVCKDCGYVFEEVTEPTTDPTTEPTTDDPEEPTQHTHTWDNGTVQRQPSCTEKGVIIYHCTECGVERTVYTDELGHDYVATVTAPTCTEDGYTTYKCSRCGNSYVSDYVDATGHSYEYVSNGDGTHHQVCSNCGNTTADENCVKTSVDGKTVCEDCGYVFETVTDKPSEPITDPTTDPTTDKPSEPDTEPSSSEPTSDTEVTEKPSETPTEPSEDASGTTLSETESTVTTASSEDSSTTQNNDTSEKVTDADIPDTGNSYNCAWIYGAVLGTVCVVTIIILKNKTKKHDLKHDEN